MDDQIYRCISQWTAKRHNNKNLTWIRKTYFHQVGKDNWVFFGTKTDPCGKEQIVNLVNARATEMTCHVKTTGDARFYDPLSTLNICPKEPKK